MWWLGSVFGFSGRIDCEGSSGDVGGRAVEVAAHPVSVGWVPDVVPHERCCTARVFGISLEGT